MSSDRCVQRATMAAICNALVRAPLTRDWGSGSVCTTARASPRQDVRHRGRSARTPPCNAWPGSPGHARVALLLDGGLDIRLDRLSVAVQHRHLAQLQRAYRRLDLLEVADDDPGH